VKGYGEAEFIFSTVKVIAVIGFIILGVILNIGGGPGGSYIGGKFWREPGAFHNGFKGLCSVFVTAAFAFAGTELVGLAAAETANPRKSLPTAIKQVFWRITLFYIVSLLLIGLLVPYDEPRLLNGKSGSDATASPFVIAIQNAGIAGLPSVMNVVIMIAVLSVGNSAIFGSSRTLAALAEQRQAPKIFAYIDRKGRPIVSIALASCLGGLAFLAGSNKQEDAFNWMIAISGLSSIMTWMSICLAHIRKFYPSHVYDCCIGYSRLHHDQVSEKAGRLKVTVSMNWPFAPNLESLARGLVSFSIALSWWASFGLALHPSIMVTKPLLNWRRTFSKIIWLHQL
jgi:yeast amino acid transporter